MAAFHALLRHMYEDTKEEERLKMDIREVFKVADLAERYHLPRLMAKAVHFAENLRFQYEEVLDIFSLAEQFHVFKELSEALKENIADFLVTVIKTPEDLNDRNKDFLGRSNEDERNIGLRMLALIDHKQLVYVDQGYNGMKQREVISHIRHIERYLQPRKHLQQLKDITERLVHQVDREPWMNQEYCEFRQLIGEYGEWNMDNHHFVIESLKLCSVLDAEKAAEKGIPLTVDTLVEDNYTHGMSVKLHLKMVDLTFGPILYWKKRLEEIWNVLEKSIPQVQNIILIWLHETFVKINVHAKEKLVRKLSTCDEDLRALPGYNSLYDSALFS